MCNNTLSPTPLPRCGSVVIDFMMRFNQSVVVSNVLTLLSDAARQGQFGGFKVNPDSIELVLRPTDGSESTAKGKHSKEIVYTIYDSFKSREQNFSNNKDSRDYKLFVISCYGRI